MVKVRWQQRPDGSTVDGDEDNISGTSEVKTLTSGSIPNNLSSAFRSDDVDEEDAAAAIPKSSGTAAADSSAESSTNKDEVLPALQDRLHPPEDDVSDDVVATPLDDVRVKLCEEGCVSPTSIDDHDSFQDDGSNNNNNNELQPLRRDPSIKTQESDYTKRCLPEDTFSFLIYSRGKSCTFFLATFVFLFQIVIYTVLALDIIDVSKKKNPFQFPVSVDYQLRIAEALAIVVAIITQDDVRKAVNLIRDGFDEDLAKAFPGATKAKWILSIALRAFEGLFGLFLTFLLIMQSDTVRDLLLNFLALEFVSLLDDVVFVLTREGFFGRGHLQKEAMKVSNTFYHVSHFAAGSWNATFVTVAYFIVLFTIMFATWSYFVWEQISLKYLCQTIFLQFDDEALPMLGSVSGLFYRHKQRFGGRLSYWRGVRDEVALLAYCTKVKRWTLSLTTDNDFDPCIWDAASSESQNFDVSTTADSQWVVRTPKGVAPLSQHFIACYDCTDNSCGRYGTCAGYDGDGSYTQCECEPGHYGFHCEYTEPCQRLEIKQSGEGFVKASGKYFASKYYLLKDVATYNRPVATYNRPVYTSLDPRGGDQMLTDDTDFIIFTGLRWILSYKQLFPGLKDVNDVSGLAAYFSQFHGLSTNYSASYVSEQVQIDTPVSDTLLSMHFDKPSPVGLRWLHSSASDKEFDQRLQPDLNKGFIDTSFFCAFCDIYSYPCPRGAVCQLNGTCGGCPNGSSGTMCQIPSEFISNGQCDSQFNTITYAFDGGDCCENTCRSTPENTCGKAGQGYIDTGYPLCVRASNQWELSGDPIHGESSGSRSDHSVALSGKGTILAVADPGVSIVRLFDKEGSTWIERGQVQGPPESNFGLAISLSDESYNISRNPRTTPTVTLAVGAPKLGLVRVFKCSTTGCIQRGEDIVGSGGFGSSLSISKDGNSIAIGGADRESIVPEKNASVAIGGADNPIRDIVGDVKVFTWSKNTNDWQQKGNVTLATPWSTKFSDTAYQFGLQAYYVSLSGDYLAVGTLEGEVTTVPRFESVNLITEVYKWNESTGWNRLGDEIKQYFYDDASFGDPWPLKPVVIKGRTLAIGSNSSVDVYSWNEASQYWIPREIESKGSEVKGLVGWSVDLSEDANILAVGVSVENPLPTDESIRMYKWNGTRYNALFNGVPGGTAAYVSLSSDGRAVAIGLPFDAPKGGSTRVYSFHPSSPCDNPSVIPLRISFTTDGRPEETSWELQVDSEVKRSSGSLSGYMYTTFVEEMCIPETSCVRFTVYDTQGDGLNPPGVFALMRNGTEVARGGNFENVTCIADGIGGCECT